MSFVSGSTDPLVAGTVALDTVNKEFTMESNSLDSIGVYELKLTTWLGGYRAINSFDQTFSVSFQDLCTAATVTKPASAITTLEASTITYNLLDPQMVFSFDDFTRTPAYCNLDYELVKAADGTTARADIFSIDSSARTVTVHFGYDASTVADLSSYAGTYNLEIRSNFFGTVFD